jgi:hypothetical protein
MRFKCWHGPGRSTVNAPSARVADHGVARADGDLLLLLAGQAVTGHVDTDEQFGCVAGYIAGPGRLLRTLASPIHLFCISFANQFDS